MTDLQSYWEDGFVLIPALFRAPELSAYEARFCALARGEAEAPPGMVLMRDVDVVAGAVEPETMLHGVNKLLSFEDDPELFAYAEHAGLLEAVRTLIGQRVMTISTNVFNKPPGVDGRHPLHQDLRYFSLRPADQIIGTWTAIGETHRENGCLVVVPGSHRGGLREHGDPGWDRVNSGFFAARDVDLDARQYVEMEPGDTLLFHPLLIHGSGRNRSNGFRRAISTHYASLECTRPGGPRKREPVTRVIESG